MTDTPYLKIKDALLSVLSSDLIDLLPNKWEKIGDILILKINPKLNFYKENICKVYGEFLNCKSVLQNFGVISGLYRIPETTLIYGDKNTITIHNENRIRYKLDPSKIMFSSGNIDERIRMGYISNKNETIVDLFAGIGYFSIPVAVYSKPMKIFSCEINPISYDFLCENIALNHVTEIINPVLGDNRDISPSNIADRVIMGHFGNTYKFIPTALKCLKESGGFIHYHDILKKEQIPLKPMLMIGKICKKYFKKVELTNSKIIKSYAPGINHFVLDLKIGEI